MNLKGKVALVTGAAQRIGREIALALAKRGCHVAITYRTSRAEAHSTLRSIQAYGVDAKALKVDQRQAAQVRRVVKQVTSHFRRIDVLINNASSFYPTPLGRVTDAQWEDLIRTNLTGPWAFCQMVGPTMKKRGSGKIINIVDVAAFSPWKEYLPYSVAKGGLVTLTWGLAKALAPEVQVNAVAPGPVLFSKGITRQEKERAIHRTLLKRAGLPQDVVQAVLFFLEGSDYATGVVLPVDGGRLLA